MLQKILESLNFTKKEAQIYLCLLKIGNATVTEIASFTKINRITVYDNLDELINRGVVKRILKNSSKLYFAEDPERILRVEESKVLQFRNHIEDFKSLKVVNNEKSVMVYEGVRNLSSMYDDIYSHKGITKCFINLELLDNQNKKILDEFVNKRIKQHCLVYTIIPKTEYSLELYKSQKDFKRKIKLLTENRYNFESSFVVTNGKLYIIDFSNPVVAILIDNPKVAGSFEKLFNLCWDSL
ncbi:TrmB family transcriptional regulator [bacterium]|jgi:sugar-specific transcriptional regulator TrmB|nr:TrmB family transcriptional regulator [bacterium]MBT6293318.1 TrmB family transcriptional regulator [bacterium]